MSRKKHVNLAASVRQRLLDLSREKGEDFNLVLVRYASERILYRLSVSEHAENFALKGAMLFSVWTGQKYRSTRDIDLLGYGDASQQRLMDVFKDICTSKVEPDGLEFKHDTIEIVEIREEQRYEGQRVKLNADLAAADIRVQIDIGFGDVVTPDLKMIEYPTLLDFPAPRIKAYPPETVVAEKLQAMVVLGMVNTRMKDFYDLLMMAKQWTFESSLLTEAISATFNRRGTDIPNDTPIFLTGDFSGDPDKIKQWDAFIKRNEFEWLANSLPQVIEDLREFLMPLLLAATKGESLNKIWTAGGPWKPSAPSSNKEKE